MTQSRQAWQFHIHLGHCESPPSLKVQRPPVWEAKIRGEYSSDEPGTYTACGLEGLHSLENATAVICYAMTKIITSADQPQTH